MALGALSKEVTFKLSPQERKHRGSVTKPAARGHPTGNPSDFDV